MVIVFVYILKELHNKRAVQPIFCHWQDMATRPIYSNIKKPIYITDGMNGWELIV